MRLGTLGGLTLALLAACDGGAVSSPQQLRAPLGRDGEVTLLSASSSYCASRCASPELSALLRVKNLAYDKQIALVVRNPAGGPWTELGGWFQRSAGSDYDLWNVASFIPWQGDYEFAVKYTTDGHTYWDNNDGANYLLHVSKASPTDNVGGLVPAAVQLVSLPVSVNSADTITGTVMLQNLAFAKKVNVVHSFDHWVTTQTAAADFVSGPTRDGAETWRFTIAAPTTPADLELAVSYEVAGTTYWDSFSGHNYHVEVR